MSQRVRERATWWMVVLGMSFLLVDCSAQVVPALKLSGNLPISVVKTITAGEPVVITIGPVAAQNGMPVMLVIVGSYGPRVYETTFSRGVVHFVLAGKETQQSGVVSLTALADQAQGTAQFLIYPSDPIEPLSPLVGARSIVADGDHWSMAVLVAFDKFGNPIMEGTPVEVLVLHPGNRMEKKLLEVHNLLAWVRIFSGTKAGRTSIVGRIGGIRGFEGTLLEVAGWPVSFGISADPQTLPADGRVLMTFSTAIIRDKFGNALPDGTPVSFIVSAPDGTLSSIPTYTIAGVATAPFQVPRQPGAYAVQATVLGMESAKIVVQFSAGLAIGTFPIVLRKDPVNSGSLLQAGPMLGFQGQYIPDGTPVRFLITNAQGQMQELDGISDAGYADVEVLVAQFPAGVYTVQVLVGSGEASRTFTLA